MYVHLVACLNLGRILRHAGLELPARYLLLPATTVRHPTLAAWTLEVCDSGVCFSRSLSLSLVQDGASDPGARPGFLGPVSPYGRSLRYLLRTV